MAGERRNFVRVSATLPLEIKVITREEAERLKDCYSIPWEGLTPLDVKARLEHSDLPQPLVDVLLEVNRKLDLILSIVSSGEECRRVAGGEWREVEISGTGLGFFWDKFLPPGTVLDIKFLLPTVPFRPIRALGEVVRAEERRGKTWLGVKFTLLREEDREEIVRFTFLKQKELLRQKAC